MQTTRGIVFLSALLFLTSHAVAAELSPTSRIQGIQDHK
jgi:hypothetical protein